MSCRDTTYVSTLLLLFMHTRTTVGAYRITYADALRITNGAYAQLMLLGDCCARYSILTGIIIDVRYAPCNGCVMHSLCCGLCYYHTRRNTFYVTYDVMLLLATYVCYLCCSMT
jgi:hypothetical protein